MSGCHFRSIHQSMWGYSLDQRLAICLWYLHSRSTWDPQNLTYPPTQLCRGKYFHARIVTQRSLMNCFFLLGRNRSCIYFHLIFIRSAGSDEPCKHGPMEDTDELKAVKSIISEALLGNFLMVIRTGDPLLTPWRRRYQARDLHDSVHNADIHFCILFDEEAPILITSIPDWKS